MVQHIKAPPQLEALFAQTEERISQIFKKSKFDPSSGVIEISDERYLLVRSASLSVDFFECIHELYQKNEPHNSSSITRQLLYDIGHAIGKKDAVHYAHLLDLQSPMAQFSAGPLHFSYTGWAVVQLLDESNISMDEQYMAIYDHPNSFESVSWINAGKKSDVPVCQMNAGYSSGWCEQCFGMPLVAEEILCMAKGDSVCRFVMAPPAHIDEQVDRYIGKHPEIVYQKIDYKIPVFFQLQLAKDALTNAQDTLKKINKNLAQQKKIMRNHEKSIEALNIKLKEKEMCFDLSFDYAAIGMALVSPDGHWIKVNPSFCKLLGYSEDELLKLNFQAITHADDLGADIILIKKMFSGSCDSVQLEKRYIKKDRKIIWVLLTAGLVRSSFSHEPLYFIAQIQDITTQKHQESELKNKAYLDYLTELSNRRSLDIFFESCVKNYNQNSSPLGIYYIDLDYFKQINDDFGHAIGDKLLKIIAHRLKNAVRAKDLVARIGGDEFIIIAPGLKSKNAIQRIAMKIRHGISKPILIETQMINVTVSIGVSVYPKDGTHLKDLLQKADLSLYHVKKSGRDHYRIYEKPNKTTK